MLWNSPQSPPGDAAENSIMQTISIAVSAILIAAGLITAPSLINNARDTNAKGDLANLAQAQESYLAETGSYSGNVDPRATTVDGALASNKGIKFTVSLPVESLKAITCKDASGDAHYIMRAVSASGNSFFRTDSTTRMYRTAVDVPKPDNCFAPGDLLGISDLPDGAGGAPGTGGGGTPGTVYDPKPGGSDTGSWSDLPEGDSKALNLVGVMSVGRLGGSQGTILAYGHSDGQAVLDTLNLQGSGNSLPSGGTFSIYGADKMEGSIYVGSDKVATADIYLSRFQTDQAPVVSTVSVTAQKVTLTPGHGVADWASLLGPKASFRVGGSEFGVPQTDSYNLPVPEEEYAKMYAADGFTDRDTSNAASDVVNMPSYVEFNVARDGYAGTAIEFAMGVGTRANPDSTDAQNWFSGDIQVKQGSGWTTIARDKQIAAWVGNGFGAGNVHFMVNEDETGVHLDAGDYRVVLHASGSTHTIALSVQ